MRALGFVLVGAGSVLVAAGRVGGELTGRSSTALGWKQWAALWAGIGLMLGGTALLPLTRRCLFSDATRSPRWPPALILAGAALLLVWALLVGLDQSLGHDEAFSVLHYSAQGPGEILFGHYLPNNHLLFNLLAWATTGVVGKSDIAYRFWSVIPALAAAGAICWWSWTRLGHWVAVAVGLLVATSPLMLTLAPQARGYGLVFLAGVLMLIFAARLAEEPSGPNLAGFGVAGLVGAATLPVFAVAFGAQALPLMVSPQTRTRVALTLATVGGILLVLYVPLSGDVLAASDQQFGWTLPWHGPLSTAAIDLLGPNVQFVSGSELPPARPDSSVAGDNAIAGAIALIGALLLWRTGERLLMALLVVPPLFLYLVLTIGDFFVAPRFAAFLLFHVIVLAACGIVGLIELIPVRVARGATAAGVAVAASCATFHAAQASDALHDLPAENFKEAAKVARAGPGSLVLTDSTRPQGLQYYLGKDNLRQQPADELERLFCSSTDSIVYVEHPYRGGPTEAPPPDLRCLRRRGARMVRLPQRVRGEHIDVWILAP